ncbi:D-glycerate dehydrogenase [Halobacillus sp. A1]|uniref:2-hydroxyacid dehydrogenase n=1 Tax=Halobacillus sp. A1 TaxID=2880262 RepID=UPI0020A6634A|nr:D-glycerate dehydrogenase [Halobacillus sp. A1]MCP3032788.1 D-glycerate dehydrogenase [Halobacillus sp. A1]
MNKPYVYVTRKLPEELLTRFKGNLDLHMWESETEPVPPEVLKQELEKADGVLTTLTDQVDDQLLDHSSHLKVVANMAVGFDNIDVDSAEKRNVIVTNTPDVLTDTTADLAFTLLTAAARRVVEAAEYVKEGRWGKWSPFLLAGSDVHHKKLGIVGMGRIGEAVAKRAKGFEMDVAYYNRTRKIEAEEEIGVRYESFDNLIESSDFVMCLVPLTKETTKLFNKEVFKKMKHSSIFINVSRGATVDEDDLYAALQSGEIKGAGLDVFENEPISSSHPLLSLKQVVCLPHIGSASIDTREAMITLCLENLSNVLSGKEAVTPVN